MQKSVAGLTVALATVLALIVTIPNAVLGGVTQVRPANDPETNGSAPESVNVSLNISLHDVVLYAKVVGLEITVEEMKQYDSDHDGFISKQELDQFPMLINLELFRNIEDLMKISLQDALTALKESGLNITVEKLNEYDLDQDGFLSVKEIIKVPIDETPSPDIITFSTFGNRKVFLKDIARLVTWISIHGKKDVKCNVRDLIGLDLDKNGILSKEEFDTLLTDPELLVQDPFSELIESKVTVSLADAVKFLKEREYEVTVADLEPFDLDHDGFLCFTEINKIPQSWRPKGPPSDVVDSFKISLEDSVVLFKGLFLIKGDFPHVISQKPFDLDNDGFLSYKELKAIPTRDARNFLSFGLFETQSVQ